MSDSTPSGISDIFAKTSSNVAILGIGIVFGIYAKLTEDLKPLLFFAAAIAILFLLRTANLVLGKLNEQPED